MSLFELILGTYEEFTLGYKYNTTENASLSQSFASHSHSASIRCLAQCGPYIATGGSDDRIVVYNLKTRKEQCMLTHHNGTVNSVKFNDECTHLFSAGQDGVFAITRIGNWIVEKLWDKAHKGESVVDIAVHKTGKLALTLGLDFTLRTWNLIKGRQAYIINLTSKCLDVRGLSVVTFNPDGVRFALSGGRTTEVWSIESGGQLGIIDHGSNKAASCIWLNEDTLLTGLEDGTVSCISTDSSNKVQVTSTHKAHDSRVKCLSTINTDDACQIVSAASSGEIKIWAGDFNSCLSRVTADCRLTCLVVANISSYVKKEVLQPKSTLNVELKSILPIAKAAKRKGVVVVELDEEEPQKKKSNKKKKKNKKVTEAQPINNTKGNTMETKVKMPAKQSEKSKGIVKKKFKKKL